MVLIDELDRHIVWDNDLDRPLECCAWLDPALLAAIGGDRFSASPVRLVGVSR